MSDYDVPEVAIEEVKKCGRGCHTGPWRKTINKKIRDLEMRQSHWKGLVFDCPNDPRID